MKTLLTRTLVVSTTLAVLAAGHMSISARTADASDKYTWGIGTQGETCGGTCGSTNLCCKIVILPAG